MLRRAFQAALVVGLGTSLAGCSAANYVGGLFDKEKPAAEAVCPAAGVLDNAGTLTRFAEGRGQDLSDVALQVSITNVQAKCSYRASDRTLTMDTSVEFRVERGPASQRTNDHFAYFVAITDSSGNVVARQAFDKPVDFVKNQPLYATTDQLRETIPIGEGQGPASYRVYVALQLTAEELNYNRRGR